MSATHAPIESLAHPATKLERIANAAIPTDGPATASVQSDGLIGTAMTHAGVDLPRSLRPSHQED